MECSCPKTKCTRHGNCDACIAYHKTHKREPYCLRKAKKARKASRMLVGIIIIIGVIVMVSACSADSIYCHITNMEIGEVDLSRLSDGAYNGEFSYGKNTYAVRVAVRDHRIEDIELDVDTKESNRDYVDKVKPLIGEVISTQSLKVDAISGATRSSKSILKAIETALAPQ